MAEYFRRIAEGLWLGRLGVLWAVIAAICAISGPFGTFQLGDFATRLMFWGMVSWLAMMIGWAVRVRAGRMGLDQDGLWSALVTATVSALVIGPIIHILLRWWFFDTLDRVPEHSEVLIVVFLLTLGVCVLRVAIISTENGSAREISADQVPRIVRRLDPQLHGDLIAVSVRDHYVDVRTNTGQGSLLMRFSDAIAECAPVEGVQVHRSYWVAWSAIEKVERDGAKLFLKLVSGNTVPVSRNHRSKLVERGLI